MQGLLELMQKVWLDCNFPPFSFQPITDKKWRFKLDHVVLSAVETYWPRLSYSLCEQNFVNGAFEVPFSKTDNLSIIWISDLECEFFESENLDLETEICKPQISHPIMIAIGGPSGVGKTTIVRKLQKDMLGQIITYPAYTTRPRRPFENDGVDYHFRTSADLESARQDQLFAGFVEARGNWYWINPGALLQSVWQNPDKIHVFFISQRKEVVRRRKLFPKLQWIWLDADEMDIRKRLASRGDQDVNLSIEYNRKLAVESIDDLLDLRIPTLFGEFDQVVQKIKAFCLSLKGS